MTAIELTRSISLTGPGKKLNPDAVGWARHPLVETAGIGQGLGRNKRWEYWAVITPSHILAMTISAIDYAAVHEAWVFDRMTRQGLRQAATVIPPRGVTLPARLDAGPARATAKNLDLDIEPLGALRNGSASSVRLRARMPRAQFDLTVTRPAGHECLAVVVPWSSTRFQYTVKDVALPASGTLTVDGVTYDIPGESSWAVLDHGRGRWPYNVHWNWGAGSGIHNGHTIGIQLGGKWTDGTGQTENGIVVDGRLTKIHHDLIWDYDPDNWMQPWRITGGGLDATFVPDYDKESRMNLLVLSARTDQWFGRWSGTLTSAGGQRVEFDDIDGWAEDVHNRW